MIKSYKRLIRSVNLFKIIVVKVFIAFVISYAAWLRRVGFGLPICRSELNLDRVARASFDTFVTDFVSVAIILNTFFCSAAVPCVTEVVQLFRCLFCRLYSIERKMMNNAYAFFPRLDTKTACEIQYACVLSCSPQLKWVAGYRLFIKFCYF